MNSKQTGSVSRLRWLKEPRLLIVAVGVTLMVVLTALAFVSQPTVAAPPPPLTGKFNFIEIPNASRRTLSPLDATITPTVVLSETFDNFNVTNNPTVAHPGWQVFVQSPAPDQKWGQVWASDSVFTNTLWSTGYYTHYQTSAATYAANMNAWVVYGPLDPSNYRDFEATFDLWPDFKVAANTKVGWAASIDGTNFCGQVELQSDAKLWLHKPFVLPKGCAGQSGTPVYLAFFFQSDSSTPVGLGAFLDNVEITAYPPYKTYLVMIRRDPTPEVTPTPTAPPYPVTQYYNFESDSANISNTSKWCRASYNEWASDLIALGGSQAYYLAMKQPYMWALSPRESSAPNYRITANFSLLRMNSSLNLYDYRTAQFGLLFSVKGAPFDPNNSCSWNEGEGISEIGFYRFVIKINGDGSGYKARIERWEGGVIPDPDQPGWVDLTGVTISRAGWNTMRIDRDGANIKAYINDVLVQNWDNSLSNTGGWFGLFTDTRLCDAAQPSFEADWDNITVYNLRP